MEQPEIDARITSNPEILLGTPIIRGTRIPVELIVGFVEAGHLPEQIADDYPVLSVRDIEAAVAFTESERQRTDIRPLFQNP